MEPYSAWADWLNKFHTASETIQALWIVASAVTVIGVTWVVTRGVVEVVRVWREVASCWMKCASQNLRLSPNSPSCPDLIRAPTS